MIPITWNNAKPRSAPEGRNRAREIRVLPPDTPDRHLSSNRDITALIDSFRNGLLKGQLDPLTVRECTRLTALGVRLYEASNEDDPGLDIIVQKLNEGELRRRVDHPRHKTTTGEAA